MMSAGSHTEPGGYTGEGRDDLHLTVRGSGRTIELRAESRAPPASSTSPTNARPPKSPRLLRARGFDPVWKDWDAAILADT